MDVARRTMVTAGLAALADAAAGPARACSLSATRSTRFSQAACEREIEALVAMLNQAPSLAPEKVQAWYDERRFFIDRELSDRVEGDNEPTTFLRGFRLSEGKLDPKPIRLAELTLVRQRGNLASFAFTLKRTSFHAADPEGCNGLFTHGEFYGEEEEGCIAAFQYNRLTRLKAFPEWFAGGREG